MTPIFLSLTLQMTAWTVSPGQPTVGDTIWLDRQFAVESGAHARLEPLEATDQIQPLLDPRARTTDGTLTVRYGVAVFQPGRVPVAIPAVEVQYPDGRAVVFPADTLVVDVSSVLPQVDPLPDPKLSLGPLARDPNRWWPLVALVALTLVGVTAWGVKRRRPKQRPPWGVPIGDPVPIADERWAKAGEARAVAAAVADALRFRIATALPGAARHLTVEECLEVISRERPKWPLRDLGDVLRSLERARFAPAVPDDVWELGHRADALARQLRGENGSGET
jgi:hypothetical protein